MSVSPTQADVDIDLGRLVGAIGRRWKTVLVATLMAAGLAFLITMALDSLYKAETRILIAGGEPVYSGQGGQNPANGPSFDEASVASQVEILKSADLIKKVADELNLASYSEFDAKPSALSSLLAVVGLEKNPAAIPASERVLKEFNKKLEVYVVPSSRIITIEFTSKDPKLAAEVANALADAYLEFNAGLKIENNSNASAWLGPEIDNLRQKVRDSEEAVAKYRADKGLLLVNEKDTIAAKQLSDISTELSRVRGEQADAEARARSVRAALESGQDMGTLGDVLGASSVQRLRERESAARAQLADLSATLLDGHPRIKALKAQVADLHTQVQIETQKVLDSLENNARLSRIREEELTAQLNELKSGSARAGEEAVQLQALEREAAAQRDLLETYLARYRESASRSEPASAPADARVISRAVAASEPYFPKTIPIIIVAALAGFLFSAIWIMLSELLSGRALRPAEGVDAGFGSEPELAAAPAAAAAATAAVIPLTQEKEWQQTETADHSVEAVADLLMNDRTPLAVSVSPEGDQGSAGAVELARQVAGEGARVLLIDLTGSGLPTNRMADAPSLPGLTDLLCGNVQIAEAIHADRASDAQIIPQGNASARRAMRAIDRLPMILDMLTSAYDLVIVECGQTDAAGIARIARRDDAEVVLSLAKPEDEQLEALLNAFFAAGFEDVLLMTPKGGPSSPYRRRQVA